MVTDRIAVDCANDIGEIDRLRQELVAFGKAHGLGHETLTAAQLALEEIATNVIRHAYGDRPERFQVRWWLDGPELMIEVADRGPPFDPLAHPAPDVDAPIEY